MRESTDITISRFTNNGWTGSVGIIGVPITPASRRKYHLMTEDSITLNFSIEQPIEFKVGDFIIDEIFGLFILREKQFPTYNKTTGGYDYQLRFDNAYWLWNNHINMLTAPLDGATPIAWTESEGTTILDTTGVQRVGTNYPYKRQEAVWCLTNSLAYHVEQVLCNILAADLTYYGRPYNARILPSATKAKEIRFINYDAKRICESLTEIANEYECEWWVTYEGTPATGWINFGKCELGNTAKEFTLGDNVETMQASRDLTNYANRLYVFGGTKNVPQSYRKKLLLHIDSQKTIDGLACCMDSVRKVNPYTMLQDEGTLVEQMAFQLTPLSHPNIVQTTPSDNEIFNDKSIGYSIVKYRSVAHKVGDDTVTTFSFRKNTNVEYTKFTAGISYLIVNGSTVPIKMELRLFFENTNDTTDKIYLTGNGTASPYTLTTTHYNNGSDSIANLPAHNFVNEGKVTLKGGVTYKLVLEGRVEFGIIVDFGNYFPNEARDFILVTEGEDKMLMPAGKSFDARVVYDNNTYDVTFNPSGCVEGEEDSFYFSLDASQWQQLTWDTKHVYSGTAVNSTLTYATSSNYDCMKVACQEGDVFKITGHGGSSYRLYAWLNSQDVVIQIASSNLTKTDFEVTAPANAAYLVVNAHRNYTRSVYAQSSPEVVELLDYRPDMVETAWYTDNTDDPSSLIGLGDRRLRLPFYDPDSDPQVPTNGYVEIEGDPSILEVQRTEIAIKNDSIYPKCYLRVTEVRTEDRTEKMVYADGTEYEWPWKAYIFKAEIINGYPFPFQRKYVKDGEKLRALFLSDYDEQNAYEEMGIGSQWSHHDGYLLAGMEFDVGFSTYNGNEYTLIRNEDYGVKLPSSMLMPKVGDTFVLTGWNVESISNLGLVRIAEEQLWYFALDYLEAMQEDGWTFRCSMMTDIEEPLYPEGTKVRVYHESLAGGFKDSRIIGYELKLDIPEDSPVYEVGETDAYSRIKQLEKQVEKL